MIFTLNIYGCKKQGMSDRGLGGFSSLKAAKACYRKLTKDRQDNPEAWINRRDNNNPVMVAAERPKDSKRWNHPRLKVV